jgi:hypothetical protein
VQRVEELFMEQDQHDEGPDHRGADASMHQTDQSNWRGADPHVEPVVAPDAPAEEFPDDTAAIDNDNDTSTDAEVNLGRERGILPASALGIHADGLEDAVSEDGDELAVPMQDAEAPLSPPEPPPDSGRRSTRFCGQKHVRVCVNAEKTIHAFHIGLRRALKRHGDSAKQAMQSELKQMEEKEVWSPVPRKDLSAEETKQVIRSYLFLKETFAADGSFDKLKAKLVAGVDGQDPSFYPLRSSPTELHLPGIGDCSVRREKHCHGHIGGAYLTALMSSVVYMQLGRDVAAALVELAPKKYSKYLGMDGTGTLIVRLRKALYGCVESARLWFNTISSTLVDYGLESNPMAKCVLSKAMPKEKVEKGQF